ncbi:hypothetical protein [Dermabacter hominis]|nr:hypothetical protein [Enterococcus faecium]
MPTKVAEQWNETGYVKLQGHLTEEGQRALRAEARDLESDAVPRGVSTIEIRRDGSFASPSQFRVHSAGPTLQALHRNKDLLATVRTITGLDRLIPVRATYNYYSPGDYMGVHRDEIRATVTLTFPLTDGMPPTHYKAEGREWDDDSLMAYVEENGSLPEDGDEMTLEPDTINMFDGYNIPHWRAPVTEQHILGNLIYFRL